MFGNGMGKYWHVFYIILLLIFGAIAFVPNQLKQKLLGRSKPAEQLEEIDVVDEYRSKDISEIVDEYNGGKRTVVLIGDAGPRNFTVAKYFFSKGWNVVLGVDDMAKVPADVQQLGINIQWINDYNEIDVTNLLNMTVGNFQKIDVLLLGDHNVDGGVLETADPFMLRQLYNNYLYGFVQTVKLAIPFLRENLGSRIIYMSSLGGRMGLPLHSVQNSLKFAMEGLLDGLYFELAEAGIKTKIVRIDSMLPDLGDNYMLADTASPTGIQADSAGMDANGTMSDPNNGAMPMDNGGMPVNGMSDENSNMSNGMPADQANMNDPNAVNPEGVMDSASMTATQLMADANMLEDAPKAVPMVYEQFIQAIRKKVQNICTPANLQHAYELTAKLAYKAAIDPSDKFNYLEGQDDYSLLAKKNNYRDVQFKQTIGVQFGLAAKAKEEKTAKEGTATVPNATDGTDGATTNEAMVPQVPQLPQAVSPAIPQPSGATEQGTTSSDMQGNANPGTNPTANGGTPMAVQPNATMDGAPAGTIPTDGSMPTPDMGNVPQPMGNADPMMGGNTGATVSTVPVAPTNPTDPTASNR